MDHQTDWETSKARFESKYATRFSSWKICETHKSMLKMNSKQRDHLAWYFQETETEWEESKHTMNIESLSNQIACHDWNMAHSKPCITSKIFALEAQTSLKGTEKHLFTKLLLFLKTPSRQQDPGSQKQHHLRSI